MQNTEEKPETGGVPESGADMEVLLVINLRIHIKDSSGNYITDEQAFVDVDPRSDDDEDPAGKYADNTGLARFDGLNTTGSVKYDIYVTHLDYYPEHQIHYYSTGGYKDIYFYLEHTRRRLHAELPIHNRPTRLRRGIE
jgi:hypothetical protein